MQGSALSLVTFRRPRKMLLSCSLLTSSLLLLSACQPSPPDTVKLRLSDAQSFRYLVNVEQRWGDSSYPSFDGNLTAWQAFELKPSGEQQWQLNAKVLSYNVRGADIDNLNNRSLHNHDGAETAPADKQIWSLLQQPFELTIDPQQRVFQGNHLAQIQDTPRSDDKYFIQTLFSQDAVPLVNAEFAAEVGATFSVEHPQYGQLSGEVTRVDEHSVSYRLQNAEDADVRIVNVARVDREQGWILAEATLSDWKSAGEYRHYQRFVTRQREDQLQLINLGLFDFPNSEMKQSANASPTQKPTLTAEQVLSYPIGSAYIRNNRLNLTFNHQVAAATASGHIEVDDIKLLDQQQQPIDVQLLNDFSYEFGSYYDQPNYLQTFVYHDIGEWTTTPEEQNIDKITATAAFYPYEQIQATLNLPAKGEQSSVELGMSTVTISATAKPHLFTMRIAQAPENPVYRSFPDADNLYLRIQPAPDYPDWVKDLTAQTMATISAGRDTSHYRLRFDGKVPETLTIYAEQQSQQAALSKTVSFYPDNDEHQLQLPPRELVELSAADTGGSSQIDVADAVKQVALQGQQQHRLYTRLSPALANVCTLTVSNDAQVNGQPLQWQPAPQEDDDYRRYSRHRTSQRSANDSLWQLRTADGEQQYFYGIDVTTELRCDGQPNWQAIALQDEQRPWLIDLEQLPDDTWQAEQPLQRFLSRYRFVDSEGRELALQPRSEDFKGDFEEAVLADYIIAEHYLKVAGPVARIEHFQVSGEAYQQQWQTHFSTVEEVIDADSN